MDLNIQEEAKFHILPDDGIPGYFDSGVIPNMKLL